MVQLLPLPPHRISVQYNPDWFNLPGVGLRLSWKKRLLNICLSSMNNMPDFWATVCKTVHPMLSDRCLSVLSCLWRWSVEWIKMPLGVDVGLGPGHVVLDGDLVSPKRGTALHFSAHVYCGQTVVRLSYCWALVFFWSETDGRLVFTRNQSDWTET